MVRPDGLGWRKCRTQASRFECFFFYSAWRPPYLRMKPLSSKFSLPAVSEAIEESGRPETGR